MTLRVFSYGGGWQSTAALALAARGEIDFRTFLFANVGDDSEHPGTIRYVHEHAIPFAEAHGIELHVVERTKRDGTKPTLYGEMMREDTASVAIPMRTEIGAPGPRSCTKHFKVLVIRKWLKAHGATAASPVELGIGISLDEIGRVNSRRSESYEIPVYPLLDHDPPIRRSDCSAIIRSVGLPVPPKSACWFCPFHTLPGWLAMRHDEPELFEKAANLESTINERRAVVGKKPVWLTWFDKPLRDVIAEGQMPLDAEDEKDGACDNGTCWT